MWPATLSLLLKFFPSSPFPFPLFALSLSPSLPFSLPPLPRFPFFPPTILQPDTALPDTALVTGRGRVEDGEGRGVEGATVMPDTALVTGRGRVEDGEGRGVDGATVMVDWISVAVTDGQGVYSFTLPTSLLSSLHRPSSAEPIPPPSPSTPPPPPPPPPTTHTITAVPRGSYQLVPEISPDEVAAGLVFSPSIAESVTVTSAPVTNIVFEQSHLFISGKVRCLQECDSTVTVTLWALTYNGADKGADGETEQQQGTFLQRVVVVGGERGAGGKEEGRGKERRGSGGKGSKAEVAERKGRVGSFFFDRLLPGSYRLEARKAPPNATALQQDEWCWEEEGHADVAVFDSPVTNVQLAQRGWRMVVRAAMEDKFTLTHGDYDPTDFSVSVRAGAASMVVRAAMEDRFTLTRRDYDPTDFSVSGENGSMVVRAAMEDRFTLTRRDYDPADFSVSVSVWCHRGRMVAWSMVVRAAMEDRFTLTRRDYDPTDFSVSVSVWCHRGRMVAWSMVVRAAMEDRFTLTRRDYDPADFSVSVSVWCHRGRMVAWSMVVRAAMEDRFTLTRRDYDPTDFSVSVSVWCHRGRMVAWSMEVRAAMEDRFTLTRRDYDPTDFSVSGENGSMEVRAAMEDRFTLTHSNYDPTHFSVSVRAIPMEDRFTLTHGHYDPTDFSVSVRGGAATVRAGRDVVLRCEERGGAWWCGRVAMEHQFTWTHGDYDPTDFCLSECGHWYGNTVVLCGVVWYTVAQCDIVWCLDRFTLTHGDYDPTDFGDSRRTILCLMWRGLVPTTTLAHRKQAAVEGRFTKIMFPLIFLPCLSTSLHLSPPPSTLFQPGIRSSVWNAQRNTPPCPVTCSSLLAIPLSTPLHPSPLFSIPLQPKEQEFCVESPGKYTLAMSHALPYLPNLSSPLSMPSRNIFTPLHRSLPFCSRECRSSVWSPQGIHPHHVACSSLLALPPSTPLHPSAHFSTALQPGIQEFCVESPGEYTLAMSHVLSFHAVIPLFTPLHSSSPICTPPHPSPLLSTLLQPGEQEFCVESPGEYTLAMSHACAYYGALSFSFHTRQPKPILLTPTAYRVSGPVFLNTSLLPPSLSHLSLEATTVARISGNGGGSDSYGSLSVRRPPSKENPVAIYEQVRHAINARISGNGGGSDSYGSLSVRRPPSKENPVAIYEQVRHAINARISGNGGGSDNYGSLSVRRPPSKEDPVAIYDQIHLTPSTRPSSRHRSPTSLSKQPSLHASVGMAAGVTVIHQSHLLPGYGSLSGRRPPSKEDPVAVYGQSYWLEPQASLLLSLHHSGFSSAPLTGSSTADNAAAAAAGAAAAGAAAAREVEPGEVESGEVDSGEVDLGEVDLEEGWEQQAQEEQAGGDRILSAGSPQDSYKQSPQRTSQEGTFPSPPTPQLLFYPAAVPVRVEPFRCPPPLPPVYARPGVFLTARITPALPDVNVSVVADSASDAGGWQAGEVVGWRLTGGLRRGGEGRREEEEGKRKGEEQRREMGENYGEENTEEVVLGPLYDDASYHVELKREGYIFSSTGDNSFTAEKAELTQQMCKPGSSSGKEQQECKWQS
ncbi:unnamed protein product [Closterium sp. Yama58-4]|nr:unnamed protein product [Closterium sp. Yama58-4]